jgi:flagellin
MPLRIGNNISAINAARNLNKNSADFTKRIERLSSGLRINRGADDAAGLAVSEGMRSEILGMKQAVQNAFQGTSLIQLAEGSLNETSNMLARMRELAVQSSNSTINDSNREGLTSEFNQLIQEVDRIALSTTYNDTVLLTGFGNSVEQDGDISTALAGFSGATEVGVSKAVPGTYIFTDTSAEDNQITLSITLDDGTVLSQSIDVGSALDRDNGQNLVATGTTFLANFDRMGVQVTLVGPGVDNDSETLRSTTADAGTGGDFIIDDQAVILTAGDTLANVASQLHTVLTGLTPPGAATYDATLNEIQIDTAGHDVSGAGATALGLTPANSYVDGRLNGKSIVVSEGAGGSLQVGANDGANNRIEINIGDMRASGNELNLNGLSIANQQSARATITRIDSAILAVARQRGNLGATQNRLQYTTFNLENAIENLQAAESSIRDADVAEEVSAFTRGQILTQAATAMAAQANALPQTALTLLQ